MRFSKIRAKRDCGGGHPCNPDNRLAGDGQPGMSSRAFRSWRASTSFLLLKSFALCLGLAAACFGAIDGTVMNVTDGKPQPGVNITLVKPGAQGMQTIGTTVSDASGHFVFPNDRPGGGPQLLQANYKGVNYNKLMTPNIPTSNVELNVYEATKSAAVAHIAERMLILEPTTGNVAVNETVMVQNDSKTTYVNDSTGGLQFYLPPAANGQVKVSAQGPQGMPLPQAAEKTQADNVFKVNFPIKPGQSEFQVNYVLPVGSPMTFRGEDITVKGMPSGPMRLVIPSGVTLTGDDIQKVGTEPNTQATIYNVVAKGLFRFDVAGTGSLHNDEAAPVDNSDSPQVVSGMPQVYTHLRWLIGLALGILGVGLLVLFRASPVDSVLNTNAPSHRT